MSIDSAEQSLWKPCVWGLWGEPLNLVDAPAQSELPEETTPGEG